MQKTINNQNWSLGKHALITGAASGIGKSIAFGLLGKCRKLTLLSRNKDSSLDEIVKSLRADSNNKTGAFSRYLNHQAYIRNLERYLRDGDYADDYYGEYGTSKIKWRCAVPAYDNEGEIKRTHGVFYDDIGTVWSDL